MKYSKTLFIVLMLLPIGVCGQVKDQFSALIAHGEDAKITTYYDIREENGKKIASVGNPYTLQFRYNQFDKLAGFTGVYAKETNQTPPILGGENYVANHYTAPSFFYMESTLSPGIPTQSTKYLMIIDNVIYELSGLYTEIKPGGNYSLTRYTYHIEGGSSNESKGGLKDRMKNKVMSMTTERELPKDLQVDHKKTIDTYLTEMQTIQEKADKNLTDTEKEEMKTISSQKDDRAAEGKAANQEYHEKMNKYASIHNESGSNITVFYTAYDMNSGEKSIHHISLSNGDKVTVSCDENVYLGTNQTGTPSPTDTILYTASTSCGGTYSITSVPNK